MSIDSVTLERLRELAEASKAGGWQEVVAALDMGDIVVRIRDDGDRGVVKAAQEATGLGRSTLWRRAKLAEHRELIETERPANLSEALKLIKGATAAAEEGQGQAKAKRGRPPVPAVEKLTKQLKGAAWGLAEGAFLSLDEVLEAVRVAYAGGAEACANTAHGATVTLGGGRRAERSHQEAQRSAGTQDAAESTATTSGPVESFAPETKPDDSDDLAARRRQLTVRQGSRREDVDRDYRPLPVLVAPKNPIPVTIVSLHESGQASVSQERLARLLGGSTSAGFEVDMLLYTPTGKQSGWTRVAFGPEAAVVVAKGHGRISDPKGRYSDGWGCAPADAVPPLRASGATILVDTFGDLVGNGSKHETTGRTVPPEASGAKPDSNVLSGKLKAKRQPLAVASLDVSDQGSGTATLNDGREIVFKVFGDGRLNVDVNGRLCASPYFEVWRLVDAELKRRAAEASPPDGFSDETSASTSNKRGGPRKPASEDLAIEARRERQRLAYQAKRTAPKGEAPAELRKKPGPKAKPANDGWRVSQTFWPSRSITVLRVLPGTSRPWLTSHQGRELASRPTPEGTAHRLTIKGETAFRGHIAETETFDFKPNDGVLIVPDDAGRLHPRELDFRDLAEAVTGLRSSPEVLLDTFGDLGSAGFTRETKVR